MTKQKIRSHSSYSSQLEKINSDKLRNLILGKNHPFVKVKILNSDVKVQLRKSDSDELLMEFHCEV